MSAGEGGTPPEPAGYVPPSLPGQAAGSITAILRARQVIVSGPNGGVFSYSPAAGAGNLIATAGIASAGIDPYGNNFLAGNSAYGSGFATSMQAGSLNFYTGSLAGGWTFVSQVIISLIDGHLILNANSEVAGTLTVDGNATITGTLSVNGSTSTGFPNPNATSTNGLANGQIAGTSGAASAGTAHTHGAGSYAVTSGQHNHDLQNHGHPL